MGTRLAVSFTLAATLVGGCYRSHERSADAGPRGSRDAPPLADAAPPDAPACGRVVRTIDVPAGRCVSEVIPETLGNRCARDGPIGSVVRLRRPSPGARWYFLIRSRNESASEISFGLAAPACHCDFLASASGGDLTAHGVGGDFGDPSRTEIDLVLDAEDGAMFLRVCDGPPG